MCRFIPLDVFIKSAEKAPDPGRMAKPFENLGFSGRDPRATISSGRQAPQKSGHHEAGQGTSELASLYGLIARMYLRVARVIPRAMTTAFAPMKAFAPVTAFAPMTALSLTLGFAQVIASGAGAAPFAAIVADARTGEILYSSNADARLHPASLTKMLTLYITFDAIERGEVSLDTMITLRNRRQSWGSRPVNVSRCAI